ncbi:hypothetical protein Lal_00015173 [Lupinus albus]|nr:hypothetical protein Lal_00015173 [Lupinus albus]
MKVTTVRMAERGRETSQNTSDDLLAQMLEALCPKLDRRPNVMHAGEARDHGRMVTPSGAGTSGVDDPARGKRMVTGFEFPHQLELQGANTFLEMQVIDYCNDVIDYRETLFENFEFLKDLWPQSKTPKIPKTLNLQKPTMASSSKRPRSSKSKQGDSTSKSNPLNLTRLLANDA